MTTSLSKLPSRPRRWTAPATFAASALVSASLAFGAPVDSAKGKIQFTASQSEVAVNGEFQKFAADVDFSLTKPEAGKVDFAVDVTSVKTGSSDADDLLKDKEFFDTRQFPRASFTSRLIGTTGNGQFQVRGTFTLKGHSAELVIPFTARPESTGLRIEGHFPVSRRAYQVGVGQWADTGLLADEVQIRFSLLVPR